ncbi:MAG: GNAT family N-acetyltransferase [Candidatus Bathyarchaeota archaeon]|nr:GNAT family N-acetyltransferase [Candidatus Bathyarchaeota archaeon]
MKTSFRVLPLGKVDEKQFLDFLHKDRVLHIFTIYDLKYMREKTEVWVALRDDAIVGYLLEFDKRIVQTRGDAETVAGLLPFADLDEPVLIIEPHHLAVVEEVFKPVEPMDSSSKGKITTFLVMRTDAEAFQPVIRHRVRRLGTEDLEEVSVGLGGELAKTVGEAIRGGVVFGAYDGGSLASLATVPQIIENIALIRGVYTVPSLRNRGLATSASSALVAELIRLGKEPVLWVAKDNLPARRIYEKIGFRRTGHVLLGFKAKRL